MFLFLLINFKRRKYSTIGAIMYSSQKHHETPFQNVRPSRLYNSQHTQSVHGIWVCNKGCFQCFLYITKYFKIFAAFMTNAVNWVSRGTKTDSCRLDKRQSCKNCCSKIYFQSIVCRESTRRRRLGVFLPPPTSFPAPDRLQCGVLAQRTETNVTVSKTPKEIKRQKDLQKRKKTKIQ